MTLEKTPILSLSTFALAVALWASPASLRAQINPAIVRPSPATLEIGEGQIEMLLILLENAQDAYGIDVRGSFDPQAVEIVPFEPGAPLRAGGFIKPDFVVVNAASNVSGTFGWAATQVSPTNPATGSGPIVGIQFRGKKRGASATVQITSVELASRTGGILPVNRQSGVITVVSPRVDAAGPTVPAAPLATSVLTPGPGATQAPAVASPQREAGSAVPPVAPLPGPAPRDWTAEILAGAGLIGVAAAIAVSRRRPSNAR
jgi:hypothetical protein